MQAQCERSNSRISQIPTHFKLVIILLHICSVFTMPTYAVFMTVSLEEYKETKTIKYDTFLFSVCDFICNFYAIHQLSCVGSIAPDVK